MQRANGVPCHELKLKEDCVSTIMRNLSIEKGLVKNARVIVSLVKGLNHNQADTNWLLIPRIFFDFTPSLVPWTIERRQFPLRLAYAVTYNSCQGLTLDCVALDVRVNPFAHGQLYTALTRVRRREHCIVFVGKKEDMKVKNIVYKSLLL
ncbi:hypothetical protein BJ508DRAFT_219073 [Ascobolus immersus RN42]|uniref:ATP-dependent DNA helicase n=1 Tax=Ascobolus immersus RN42 TaxID=1160509 RepID=A0A3N4HB85_ASCIM|nr:hypothetical protein BJ508DRAFT_219073 [Ascobolus immersus RN42]